MIKIRWAVNVYRLHNSFLIQSRSHIATKPYVCICQINFTYIAEICEVSAPMASIKDLFPKSRYYRCSNNEHILMIFIFVYLKKSI